MSFHRCHRHTLQCVKVTFFSSKAQSTHSPPASFPSTLQHHPKEGRALHPPCPTSPVGSLGLSAFPFKASGLLQTRLTRAKGPGPLTRGIWVALFFQISRNCDSAAKKPGAHSEDYGPVPDLHCFSLSSEITTELSLILLLALSFILKCNHTPSPKINQQKQHIQTRDHPAQLL